jgi:hypothetical protein
VEHVHTTVMPAAVMRTTRVFADEEPGKEHDCDDEQNAGDDRHPQGELGETIGAAVVIVRRWNAGRRRISGQGRRRMIGCVCHASIMPSSRCAVCMYAR